MSSEKGKLKQQRGPITHRGERPQSRTRTPPVLGRTRSNGGLSLMAGGDAKGTATQEDSSVVSYKMKPSLTTQSSSHTPWHLPKRDDNLCPQKKYVPGYV